MTGGASSLLIVFSLWKPLKTLYALGGESLLTHPLKVEERKKAGPADHASLLPRLSRRRLSG